MTRADFYEAACEYAAMTGASQTSGLRSLKHNKAVGGKPFSPHLFGRGIDLVYDDSTMLTDPMKKGINRELAARLGLFLFQEGDHDHLQPLDWKAG